MSAELDVFCEDGVASIFTEGELTSLCDAVLLDRGVERTCMVSVSFVSDESIAELTERWRDVAAPTDVLSFETERPDDPDLGPEEPCELGDIVLAPAYVGRQAGDFGTTIADETRLLMVHGMLHLLGYDHMEEEDAVVMQGIEDEILASLPGDGTLSPTVLTRHRRDEA